MARPAPGADRSVAVLELLAEHPEERFTLSEVARRCSLNKATAHALLSALTERGVLLRHPEEKRYSLGPRLVAIGDAARRGYTAVDFVRPLLVELAGETGLWARAWRMSSAQVVSVAHAGMPRDLAGGQPVRLPLSPPIGALFMAWADALTAEAWLARAGSVEVVRPAFDALPAIRQQGFALILDSPEWRALSVPAGRTGGGGAEGGAAVASDPRVQRAMLTAVSRQSLLVTELDETTSCRPAEIDAPVFDATGRVELAVSLTFPDAQDVAGRRVLDLAQRLVTAADALTDAVRGRRPAPR
ncbi:MAG TPA: helix-turn-helix domain-containing protein [Acidimicrobiales bacterium]|nr:helix-turn-helix domain-containing protein [Acidimicrobiales bacterium]